MLKHLVLIGAVFLSLPAYAASPKLKTGTFVSAVTPRSYQTVQNDVPFAGDQLTPIALKYRITKSRTGVYKIDISGDNAGARALKKKGSYLFVSIRENISYQTANFSCLLLHNDFSLKLTKLGFIDTTVDYVFGCTAGAQSFGLAIRYRGNAAKP